MTTVEQVQALSKKLTVEQITDWNRLLSGGASQHTINHVGMTLIGEHGRKEFMDGVYEIAENTKLPFLLRISGEGLVFKYRGESCGIYWDGDDNLVVVWLASETPTQTTLEELKDMFKSFDD